MTPFFEAIKKRVEQDKLFLVAYYGASTTSNEHVFPNWAEIIRYVLKCELENELGPNREFGSWWNLQTVNFGLSGATSIDLLERFEDLVLSRKPDLVFLNIGKNDAHQGVDEKTSELNTGEIIQKALDKDIKTVFTTTVPSPRDNLNENIKTYIEADRNIANEFEKNGDFIFVDLFDLFPKNLLERSYTLIMEEDAPVDAHAKPGELDCIHYNKYGNAMVAKILLKEVFGIEFDHEKFLKDVADDSVKYPSY